MSFQPNRADRLRILNEIVAASRLPVEEQVAAVERICVAHPRLPDGEDAIFFSVWTRESVRCQADLREALVAVASERYRQARGAWPDTLSALVEHHFISQVPLDPDDGQPLRYRQLADGVVFYSVCPEYVHRGKTVEGFRLWDPAR